MDGIIANLAAICELADRYDALVMVDDSHAVGFLGPQGRGTPEYHGVMGRIDILTGTLGKALGGGSGGYTSGRAEIIAAAPPALAALPVLQLAAAADRGRLAEGAGAAAAARPQLRDRLEANTRWFREQMSQRGFQIVPGEHPIVPIMLGDAALAARMAERLLERASTSSASPTRWCRRARPASAPRSPPSTAGTTWPSRSRLSRR